MRTLAELGVVVGVLVMISGCRKAEVSPEAGLVEMGYEVTTEDFHRAAEIGDVAVMERMLDEGIDLEARSQGGDTGLHAAAAAGSEAGVKFFVERGMDVNEPGARGRTGLMVAAEAGEWEVLRELLKMGAKPELVDAEGYRALTIAADVGSAESIEALAPSSRMFLDDALLLAALRGHADCAALLADYGASVYGRLDDGMTPLMLAAREGHLGTVEVLLERGANRFAVDMEERTAGQIALAAGHPLLAARLNAAPGEDAFTLPALPEWAEIEESVVPGEALLGEFVETTLGRGDEPSGGVASSGEVSGGHAEGVSTAESEGPGVGGGDEGPGLVIPVVGEESRTAVALKDSKVVVEEEGRPVSGAGQGIAVAEGPEEGRSGPGRSVGSGERQSGGGDVERVGLVMDHYEEKPLPLRIEGVEEGEVRVRYLYGENERVSVKEGEDIPLTGLRVVEVRQRLDHSKMTAGRPADISVVVVEDPETGQRRELTVKLGASAHEPFAVLRTVRGGEPLVVRRGAVVRGADGMRYRVTDVRPTQVVVEGIDSGAVLTLNATRN